MSVAMVRSDDTNFISARSSESCARVTLVTVPDGNHRLVRCRISGPKGLFANGAVRELQTIAAFGQDRDWLLKELFLDVHSLLNPRVVHMSEPALRLYTRLGITHFPPVERAVGQREITELRCRLPSIDHLSNAVSSTGISFYAVDADWIDDVEFTRVPNTLRVPLSRRQPLAIHDIIDHAIGWACLGPKFLARLAPLTVGLDPVIDAALIQRVATALDQLTGRLTTALPNNTEMSVGFTQGNFRQVITDAGGTPPSDREVSDFVTESQSIFSQLCTATHELNADQRSADAPALLCSLTL